MCPSHVRSDRRAAQLDTGLDYFNKAMNLRTALGSDFFREPGHAEASPIRLRSANRMDDGWQVSVTGSRQRLAMITLSADFISEGRLDSSIGPT
jgi:hypothetical protein